MTVEVARYTRAELEDKARTMARPDATVGGASITSVDPSNDGNALEVAVEPAPFVVPGSQQKLDGLEGDRSALTSLAGEVPVNGSTMEGGSPTVLVPKAPDKTRFEASGYLPGGAGDRVAELLHDRLHGGRPAHPGQVHDHGRALREQDRRSRQEREQGQGPRQGRRHPGIHRLGPIALDLNVKTAPTVYSEYGLGDPHGLSRVVRNSGRAIVSELLCADGALLGEQCGGKVTAVGSLLWDKKHKHYRLLASSRRSPNGSRPEPGTAAVPSTRAGRERSAGGHLRHRVRRPVHLRPRGDPAAFPARHRAVHHRLRLCGLDALVLRRQPPT